MGANLYKSISGITLVFFCFAKSSAAPIENAEQYCAAFEQSKFVQKFAELRRREMANLGKCNLNHRVIVEKSNIIDSQPRPWRSSVNLRLKQWVHNAIWEQHTLGTLFQSCDSIKSHNQKVSEWVGQCRNKHTNDNLTDLFEPYTSSTENGDTSDNFQCADDIWGGYGPLLLALSLPSGEEQLEAQEGESLAAYKQLIQQCEADVSANEERERKRYLNLYSTAVTLKAINEFENKYKENDPNGLIPLLQPKKKELLAQQEQYTVAFNRAKSIAELFAFIEKYKNNDPDLLVPKAEQKLEEGKRNQENDKSREEARRQEEFQKSPDGKLYLSYRNIVVIGQCVEQRKGYAFVYVNDEQYKKAKRIAKQIESALEKSIKDTKDNWWARAASISFDEAFNQDINRMFADPSAMLSRALKQQLDPASGALGEKGTFCKNQIQELEQLGENVLGKSTAAKPF